MNISQLQYFLAVYDCGSYTVAAETMFTSRQTLGRAVSELEKEIGHELFARKGRGIEPTDIGSEAAEIARMIVSNAHRLTSFADEKTSSDDPDPFTLAVAYNEYRGSAINPKALQAHLAKLRLNHINVITLPSESCVVATIRGLADAAIIIGRADYVEYENEFVGRKPGLVAMGKTNPLARKKSLVISDLQSVQLAIPDNMSFFYPRVNAVCEAAGFKPEWTCVSGSEKEQRDFLVNGGLMFVHEDSLLVRNNSDLTTVALEDASKLNYPIFLINNKESHNPQTRTVMRAIMGYLE